MIFKLKLRENLFKSDVNAYNTSLLSHSIFCKYKFGQSNNKDWLKKKLINYRFGLSIQDLLERYFLNMNRKMFN